MKTLRFFFSLIVLVLAVFSGSLAAEGSTQEETDIQAINEVTEQWNAAVLSGDLDSILALVTDDYRGGQSGATTIVGKEAIRISFQSFQDNYSTEDLRDVTDEVLLAGDRAYLRGSWTGTIVPRTGGDPVQVSGKWSDIRERQPDGSWKISMTSLFPDQLLK